MNSTHFFSDMILPKAGLHPDKTAVVCLHGRSARYGDVKRVFETTRDFFTASGIRKPHRIALLARDPMVYALLGLPLMERSTLILISPTLDPKTLAERLKQIGANLVLCEEGYVPYDASSATDLGFATCRIQGDAGSIQVEFSLHKKATEPGTESTDVASVSTTSGTTSMPKIVPNSHTSMNHAYQHAQALYQHRESDMALVITNRYAGGQLSSVLHALSTGGSIVLADGFSHMDFLRAIEAYPITYVRTTPAVLGALAAFLQKEGVRPPENQLQFIRASGAPLMRETKEFLEEAFSTRVIQTYGMSEAKGLTSTFLEPAGYKEGSAGLCFGANMKIQDGEILVSGPTVFSGYENPEIDNREYFENGWFHTGDLGVFDEDGYLFITGRAKEMINRGGEKISPYEVEAAILKLPGVLDVAVFPYPNSIGSEDAACVLVLEPGLHMDLKSLREKLFGHLSYYKMPTRLYLADEIPVGPGGKVQRQKLYGLLKEMPWAEEARDESVHASDQSPNKTEAILSSILADWQALFPSAKVMETDNFFTLGGDSLMVAGMFARMEKNYGVQVPMDLFFKSPTALWLADWLKSHPKGTGLGSQFLVPIKESGHKPPLICVHSGDGEAVTYHGFGTHMDPDRPIYAVRYKADWDWTHPLTFRELSRTYARDIARSGITHCHLTGTCYGGVLALETSRALMEEGVEVGMMAMLDSVMPGGSRKRYRRLARNSMDELKNLSAKEKSLIVKKKAGTLLTLLATKTLGMLYRFSAKRSLAGFTRLCGKRAALGQAFAGYRPDLYPGHVHYYEATQDRLSPSGRIDFWRAHTASITLETMPCRHNDINLEENSEFLAKHFAALMDGYDA